MSELGEEEGVTQRPAHWDHSTNDPFFEYYAGQSRSDETIIRFAAMRDLVLRALGRGEEPPDVADLGCGAGTQGFVWPRLGHRLDGLHISEKFITLGPARARLARVDVD